MKVKIVFEPNTETQRSALKLLGIHPDRVDGTFEMISDLERQQRLLGALIDVLKLAIIP